MVLEGEAGDGLRRRGPSRGSSPEPKPVQKLSPNKPVPGQRGSCGGGTSPHQCKGLRAVSSGKEIRERV